MISTVSKQKILIIDDAPANIQVLVEILGSDYEILVATDGPDGLEATLANMPDLVLLDIEMPGMDGFAVCDKLKSDQATRDIPIIFVTAAGETFNEARGLDLGAEDYINKPVSPPILKARVKNSLERKNFRSHLEFLVEERTRDLHEREEHLRSILHRSLDAIITTDFNGLVVEFNPAAERLFGFSREDVLGRHVEELIIPPELREQHRMGMARCSSQAQRASKLSRRVDVTGQRADGSKIDLQLALTSSSYSGKCYFTAFMQDITERKQLITSLNDALIAAQSSNEAKSKFLANMSHEIRTPMNGVLGMIDLALGSGLSDKARDFLSHAKTSSNLLLRVINDILDYSKIESGKLLIESVDFYLGDVLADAINLFRQAVVDKTVELVVSAPPQSIGQLVGDRLRVQQVLVNLVGNAVKFTHDGEIFLKAVIVEQIDDQVRIEFSVRDTGVGLTNEQIEKLFSPFVQADSSTTRKFGGTGLGLSICKRLVEMMGGEIWVTSTPNVGSTFCFTVLLRIKQQTTTYRPVLPADLQGLKVLVVDDNLDSRLVAAEMLNNINIDSTSVETGQQCLEALQVAVRQGSPYALILLDWRMPGMDGVETAEKIFADSELSDLNRPKIIMMTAFGKEAVNKHAQRVGVDTCLVKPMTPSLLLETVLDVFGKTVTKAYDALVDGVDKVSVIRRVGGAQVLLVEDNPINQRVAQEMLQNVGIAVTLANNGQEAIYLLLDKDFDLVFMDVQMPMMDGYQATRQLRNMEQFKSLPIIAMTAHALTGDKDNCLAAGMSDYISKPIDLQQLFRVLMQWIKPQSDSGHVVALMAQAEEKEQTQAILLNLPGIQVQTALTKLGTSVEFYREMLCDFRRDYLQAGEEIRTLLFVTHDFSTAQRQVHSIKGVAGNLGAQDLYVAAMELEQAIANDHRGGWQHLMEKFEEAMEQLQQSVGLLQQETDTPSQLTLDLPATSEVDWNAVIQHIATMSHWLQKGNVKAADSLEPLLPLLAGTHLQHELSKLEKALDQFSLGAARQHLDALSKQVQVARGEMG
ncbi:MAG: response regulator [Magnetococcales bacterium]|nr:response regulator [Magnetococcales bacterium]